jgi:hypothetical protein
MGEGARVESPLSTQSRAAYARLAPARFLLTEEMPWLAGKGYLVQKGIEGIKTQLILLLLISRKQGVLPVRCTRPCVCTPVYPCLPLCTPVYPCVLYPCVCTPV